MRTVLVLFATFVLPACSSPVGESRSTPDPDAAAGAVHGCYSVELGGTPAEFVMPRAIELSSHPAPNFVEPGRFAVRELGGSGPRAPISWWAPGAPGSIELVLGGGYTGYSFILHLEEQGSWAGVGTYFADFGVLPEPGPLPVRLVPRSCG